MRNRTPDSTTPSSPLDSTDSWVWFVTEKGLRATGATTMKAAAADLRQTAAELEKAARHLGQLCRTRHNWPYAESRIMPSSLGQDPPSPTDGGDPPT